MAPLKAGMLARSRQTSKNSSNRPTRSSSFRVFPLSYSKHRVVTQNSTFRSMLSHAVLPTLTSKVPSRVIKISSRRVPNIKFKTFQPTCSTQFSCDLPSSLSSSSTLPPAFPYQKKQRTLPGKFPSSKSCPLLNVLSLSLSLSR